MTALVRFRIGSFSGCGQSHNAHPTAKINKVKELALIF